MAFKEKIKEKVLNFYQELPFNVYESPSEGSAKINQNNVFDAYPVLKDIFEKNNINNIIDVGCGGGWFINSLSSMFPEKYMLGIDFNKVAINYALEVAKIKKLKSNFLVKDIFEYTSDIKFDFVSSIGVLHHTHDCIGGVKKITEFCSESSFLFIGLYHKYGRKPFLDFVKDMKNLSDDEKFKKYKKLHKLTSETHLKSWFRDQVLIPHETQHTYEEISKILTSKKFKILSTSINKFQSYESDKEIIDLEKKLYKFGEEHLKNSNYYPGFFIVLAQKQ